MFYNVRYLPANNYGGGRIAFIFNKVGEVDEVLVVVSLQNQADIFLRTDNHGIGDFGASYCLEYLYYCT